jgi:hypothetical protein
VALARFPITRREKCLGCRPTSFLKEYSYGLRSHITCEQLADFILRITQPIHGLKALMDFNANAATNALNLAIEGTAANPNVLTLTQSISNPPTQAQVQAIQNKLNELINAITRALA